MSEGVVTEQPSGRALPGRWAVGMINGPCCIATWIPCMSWVYQCGNSRRVGQPGLIASQGCLCVYCCFPCAMFMWAIKTRYYVKLRLGINDGGNECCKVYFCWPCVVGQTKATLDQNMDILAGQQWEDVE